MLNLYIVRHGQTKWNTERRFQGWLDSPLTENGILRAQELRLKLEPIKFDACISSPSGRAVKTLALIVDLEPHLQSVDDRIKEIMLGNWQGMTHEEIETLYPEQLDLFYNNPESFKLHDAESYQDVYDRVSSFIESLKVEFACDNEEKNVLIVTHGVTLMVFQLIFDNADISELTRYSVANNAQIHHYRYSEEAFICVV